LQATEIGKLQLVIALRHLHLVDKVSKWYHTLYLHRGHFVTDRLRCQFCFMINK